MKKGEEERFGGTFIRNREEARGWSWWLVSLERRRVKIRFTWTESLFTNLHLHFTETKQFDCLKSDFPFSINNSVCSEKDEFLAKKWFKLVIKSFILLCFYILFEKQTTFFLSSIFWAASDSEVYCVFLYVK